jgi:hypothetical protein
MKTMNGDTIVRLKGSVSRQLLFIVLGAVFILMIPLVAMQFSGEVVWDLFDFVVAGLLLVGAGVTYVVAARTVSNARYRVVLAVAFAAVLLVVWAELAVGLFGSPFAGS